MVKVLLADDHAVLRGGILRLLANEPSIQVLGDASNFSEAITKARKFRPDVLILDLHMAVEHGWSNSDLNRQLTSCGAKVLGISFANDEEAKSMAQSIGAVELLDKISLGKELIPAILRLAFGNNYSSPMAPSKTSNARELR